MAGLADLASLAIDAGILDITEETGKSRKAGQILQISENELNEILQPWRAYEKDAGGPNYYGRTKEEWLKDNTRVRNELIAAHKDGASREDAIRILQSNGFQNNLENKNILYNLHNKKILHTQDMWVPGAAADEELSKALLDYSGFTPVSLENAKGDPMATDLRVTMDGAPRYVDAQVRTRGDRSMPLEMTLRRGGAFDIIQKNPSMSLLDLTQKIRDQFPGIEEGKFLHTDDPEFNKILSRKLEQGGPKHLKDYLISSARPGSTKTSLYNKTRPLDWDLIDLNKAREILLPLTRGQMYDKYGITLSKGRFGGATLLNMPEEFIKKELNDSRNQLDSYAKFRLTRPR